MILLLLASDAALLAVLAHLRRAQLVLALALADQALRERRGGRHARAVSLPRPLCVGRHTGIRVRTTAPRAIEAPRPQLELTA